MKEQKTFGTQNRSNRGRKYGRRILCLILALVFTLTGLPTGGVEETWAAGYTYGRNSYGSFSAPSKTLSVSGSGPADSSRISTPDYNYLKKHVIKLSVGKKITTISGFKNLSNLTTLELNGTTVEFSDDFLSDANNLQTIILPPGCTSEFESKVKDRFGPHLFYDKQCTLHIINVDGYYSLPDSSGNSISVVNGVGEKKYTTSDFNKAANRQITVKIQPKNLYSNKVVFDRWVVTDSKSTSGSAVLSITGASIEADAEKINEVSGAAIITLTSEMPTDVYVTALYKRKDGESINLQTALEKVVNEINTYGEANELDSIPENPNDVKTKLKSILLGMKEMSGGIVKFDLGDDFSEKSRSPSTFEEKGQVVYSYTLTATDLINDSVTPVTSGCSLTLYLKKRDDIPYTVIVSGGSIQGATNAETVETGALKNTYYLSTIEQSGNRLPLTFVSNDRTAENYYYDGWEISSGDTEINVSLESQSSSEGKQATGSAILNLKKDSPMQIYVTAKYKYIQPENPGGSAGGGGWVPTTPTTPEKPKEEEKPKDPEKPTDAEKTDPETPTPTDPTSASKPISTTTKTNTATVSVSDLQKAVDDKTNGGMTLKYKNATVTFDTKAVESIVKQAKKIGSSSLKVVCKADAQSSLNSAQKKALKSKTVIGCYQVYLKCGSKIISDFGKGKVKVKVPLKLKSGQKSKNVKLYYVDEKGKLTKQTASYSNGQLTFSTTHFSIYAAIYPKQTTTTASDKTATSDKTGTTDKTEKPTQVIGTKNETIPGGVVDDSMIGLPKAEEYEQISYQTLQLHLSRSNDTSVCLGWNQVPGASGYELYGARCNTKTKKYEIMQITTLDAPSMNAWMCENLKKNTYYKFIVRAYMKKDGEKVYIARSRSAHVSTGGGGYGFIKDVTVDKPQVTLGVGKTTVVKATIDTAAQKIRSHYDLRFESSDSSIATVSGGGKITAKKNGTCTIYVYTQNGLYTTVKVTVK